MAIVALDERASLLFAVSTRLWNKEERRRKAKKSEIFSRENGGVGGGEEGGNNREVDGIERGRRSGGGG